MLAEVESLESVLKENGKSSPLKYLTQRLLSMLKIYVHYRRAWHLQHGICTLRRSTTNIAEQIIEKRKAILEKKKQNKGFSPKSKPIPVYPVGYTGIIIYGVIKVGGACMAI